MATGSSGLTGPGVAAPDRVNMGFIIAIVAVATTADLDVSIPRLDLDDVEAIADFVIDFCGLPAERRHGAA